MVTRPGPTAMWIKRMIKLTRFSKAGCAWRLWLAIAALTLVGLSFLFSPVGDAGLERQPVAGGATVQADVTGQDAGQGRFHTWQDGERTMRVRLLSGADITERDSAAEMVAGHRQLGDELLEALFLDDNGGQVMTLPGGVLVQLDPAGTVTDAEAFFSQNGIMADRLTAMTFADNAYLVGAPPGLPSLELANSLAGRPGVVTSVPNWRMPVESLQDPVQDDHGDTLATATDLPLDTPTPGFLSDVEDVDMFKFVLTESTFVIVDNNDVIVSWENPDTARVPFGQSYVIFDSAGQRLKGGGLVDIRLSAGTYYASVEYSNVLEHRRKQHYQVVVKTIPDHSDTMENADQVSVGPGDSRTAALIFRDFHSPTDVDFFKFELEETTEVVILVGLNFHHPWWGSMGPYNLEVLDSDGNTIGPSREGTYFYGRPYRLQAGAYYIRLSPFSWQGRYEGVNAPYNTGRLRVYTNVEYTEFVDDCSALGTAYDDPLYGCQWHLDNTNSPRQPG